METLTLIERDTHLKRVTTAGEYAGPCPVCGGKDRFHVLSGGRWFCRQCHPETGDAIEYLRWSRGLTFPEACELTGKEYRQVQNVPSVPSVPITPLGPVSAQPVPSAMPSDAWQRAAWSFVNECADRLHGPEGVRALSYLAGRGLTSLEVIEGACLGLNPADCTAQWGDKRVTLPAGIVIPWNVGTEMSGVNIRLRKIGTDGKKYHRALGSKNALYEGHTIQPGRPVVIVETELDALILRQELVGCQVACVASGSISWGRPFLPTVAQASAVFLAFDQETEPAKVDAVERAAAWWMNALPGKVYRLTPTEHDITDMMKAGQDVRQWVTEAVHAIRCQA